MPKIIYSLLILGPTTVAISTRPNYLRIRFLMQFVAFDRGLVVYCTNINNQLINVCPSCVPLPFYPSQRSVNLGQMGSPKVN